MLIVFNLLNYSPPYDIWQYIQLIYYIFIPGFYLAFFLWNKNKISFNEFIISDILISVSFNTFLPIYFSFILNQIGKLSILIGNLLLIIICCIVYKKNYDPQSSNKNIISFKNLIEITSLILCFVIGVLLVSKILPQTYWPGWDPWVNAPVVRVIANEGLNPTELSVKFIGEGLGTSGFYYMLTSLFVVTEISIYNITRYSGIIFAGLLCGLTFIILKRLFNNLLGIIGTCMLFLNPFLATRFSMSLRENFTFLFILFIILLIILKEKINLKSNKLIIFFISLSLSIILNTQLLSFLIISLVIIFKMIYSIIKYNYDDLKFYIYCILMCGVFDLPYILNIYLSFKWVIINQIQYNNIYTLPLIIILIPIIILFIKFKIYKKIILILSNKYTKVIILSMLIISSIYSLLYQKDFELLGTYNPPIVMNNFSMLSIILSIVSLIFLLKYYNNEIMNMFIISNIILLNIPNLNIPFPLFRLIIYLSWIMSYSSIITLKNISLIIGNKIKKINLKINLYKKNIIVRNFPSYLIITLILIGFMPIIYNDINNLKPKYSNFNDKHILSAIEFLKDIKENDVVIPQRWTQNLLNYVGIDKDQLLINDSLYETSDPIIFSQIILQNKPNTTRALIFIIESWVDNPNAPYPSLDILKTYGVKIKIDKIIYYILKVPLR